MNWLAGIGNWVSNLLGGGGGGSSSRQSSASSSSGGGGGWGSSQASAAAREEEERRRRERELARQQAEADRRRREAEEAARRKRQQEEQQKKSLALSLNVNQPLQKANKDQVGNLFQNHLKQRQPTPEEVAQKNKRQQKYKNAFDNAVKDTAGFATQLAKVPVEVAQAVPKSAIRVGNELTGNKETQLSPFWSKVLGEEDGKVGNFTEYGKEMRQGFGSKSEKSPYDWAIGGAMSALDLSPAFGVGAGIRTGVKNGFRAGALRSTGLKNTGLAAANGIDPAIANIDAFGAPEAEVAAGLRRQALREAELAAERAAQLERQAPTILREAEVEGGKVDDGISSPNRGQQAAQQTAQQLQLQKVQLEQAAIRAQQQAEQARRAQESQLLRDQIDAELAGETPLQPAFDPAVLYKKVENTDNPIAEQELLMKADPSPTGDMPAPVAAATDSPITAQSKKIAQEAPPVNPDVVPGTNKTKAELQGMARALYNMGEADSLAEAMALAKKRAKAEAGAAPAPQVAGGAVKTRRADPAKMTDEEAMRFAQEGETAADVRARLAATQAAKASKAAPEAKAKTETKTETKTEAKTKAKTEAKAPKEAKPNTGKHILNGGDRMPTMKEATDLLNSNPTRAERKQLNKIINALKNGNEDWIEKVRSSIKGEAVPEAPKPKIANPARTMERQDKRLAKAVDDVKAEMKVAKKAGDTEGLQKLSGKKTLLNRIKYSLKVGDRADLDALKKDNPKVFEENNIVYKQGTQPKRLEKSELGFSRKSKASTREYLEKRERQIFGDDVSSSWSKKPGDRTMRDVMSRDVRNRNRDDPNIYGSYNTNSDDITILSSAQEAPGGVKGVINHELMHRYHARYLTKEEALKLEKDIKRAMPETYKEYDSAAELLADRFADFVDVNRRVILSADDADVYRSLDDFIDALVSDKPIRNTLKHLWRKIIDGIRAARQDRAVRRLNKAFTEIDSGEAVAKRELKKDTTVGGDDRTTHFKKAAPAKASKFKTTAGKSLSKYGHSKTLRDIKGGKSKLEHKSIESIKEAAEAKVSKAKKSDLRGIVSEVALKKGEISIEDSFTALAAAKKLAPIRTTAKGAARTKLDKELAEMYNNIGDKLSGNAQYVSLARGWYDLMPAEWHVARQMDDLTKQYKNANREFKIPAAKKTVLINNYRAMQNSVEKMDAIGKDIDKMLESGNIKGYQKKLKEYNKHAQQVYNNHAKYEVTLNSVRLKATKLDKWNEGVDRVPSAIDSYVRYAMLSGIEGRFRDIISTGISAGQEGTANLVGTTLGKVHNATIGKLTGRTVKDTYGYNRNIIKKTAGDIKKDARSQFTGQADSASLTKHSKIKAGTELHDTNKGSIYQRRMNRQGKLKKGITIGKDGKLAIAPTLNPVNPLSGSIRVAVGTPTSGTVGIRNRELFQLGHQRAKDMGLPKKDWNDYANLYMHAKSQGREVMLKGSDEYNATQKWFRVNSMQDNRFSSGLKALSDLIYKAGDSFKNRYARSGAKVASGLLNRTVVPFTQWIGGATTNILTHHNPLYHATKTVDKALLDPLLRKKNSPQETIDHMSHLAATAAGWTAIAAAVDSGVISISDTDGRGDDYNGPYVKIGNTFISAPQLGPAITAGILSQHAMAKARESGVEAGGDVMRIGLSTLMRAATAFGMADSYQPELIKNLDRMASPSDGEFEYGKWQAIGDVGSTFIPALSRSVAKMTNTSDQEPETKVQNFNPETRRMSTDQKQTVLNRFQSSVPILANQLPRKEGEMANGADTPVKPNFFERVLGANSMSKGQQDLQKKYGDNKAGHLYKMVGKPDTDLTKKQRAEGDWDGYIKSLSHAHDVRKKNESPDDTAARQRNITQAKVAKKMKFTGEDIKLYEGTTKTEFAKLWNSEDQDDIDLAYKLHMIDKAMTDAKASGNTSTRYQRWLYPKYDIEELKEKAAKKKRGGGGGGRGGRQRIDTSFRAVYNITSDTGNFSAPTKISVAKIPNVVEGNPAPTKFKKEISVKKGVHL